MPRSIKPRMSNDELSTFYVGIYSIEYDGGEALLTTASGDDDIVSFWLSIKDCEDIISFIRRNQV